ncbi:MAG: cyclic nucleotide-binding domain-containing protein [Elusimicrobia bacterium]|nr:cyclic nucleotide-binding domain-containing protein [Elusimicrobiota bacterium]
MPFEDTMFLKNSVDVLSFFDVEQLRKITPDITRAKYKKDQTVLLSGEFASSFYIVKNGSVNVFTKDNPKVPSATLKKGDFFGVMSILQGLASSVAIKAAEDMTEVIEVPLNSFQKLLDMQPLLKNALIKKVEDRVKANQPNPPAPPSPNP